MASTSCTTASLTTQAAFEVVSTTTSLLAMLAALARIASRQVPTIRFAHSTLLRSRRRNPLGNLINGANRLNTRRSQRTPHPSPLSSQ
jgi:hypothetical protein